MHFNGNIEPVFPTLPRADGSNKHCLSNRQTRFRPFSEAVKCWCLIANIKALCLNVESPPLCAAWILWFRRSRTRSPHLQHLRCHLVFILSLLPRLFLLLPFPTVLPKPCSWPSLWAASHKPPTSRLGWAHLTGLSLTPHNKKDQAKRLRPLWSISSSSLELSSPWKRFWGTKS